MYCRSRAVSANKGLCQNVRSLFHLIEIKANPGADSDIWKRSKDAGTAGGHVSKAPDDQRHSAGKANDDA
ncbi:hypothetical protein IZ6_30230 [Terrihabitans soli]|uniref:Uncharacterized protein n=1 Tax=Terrihabitans soli TaxID=708113 RepID=A0A6S6R001_9HYPH|nr:hypothetical protein IZ6_30230 [Terrihabitans soli]